MQPHITYGIEVWGGANKTDLNSILLVQKMAIRAITFNSYMTRSKPLFNDLKILDVYQLHRLSICTFMYDLINSNLPHSMVQYCSFIQHRYHTRQRKNEKLYIPKVKTSLGKVCISYLGSIFWNDPSMEIRNI